MSKIEKKTWPEMFQFVLDGKKKFDARIADFEIDQEFSTYVETTVGKPGTRR